ncbi:MAG: replication initiation protein RepC [Yoonia sp.]|jgi:replication initiation protein RepC
MRTEKICPLRSRSQNEERDMTFILIGSAQRQQRQQFHNGLPETWNRDRFRQVCVSYAQIKGVSAECVRTLETMMDLISPDQFKDVFCEPFCYARQETLIGERRISPRSIFNHEKQLEDIGLIDRRVGANGSRCKRKRLGLYLTPALNQLELMMDAIAEQRALRSAHDALRGDRSRLLKHVKATLETLTELGAANEAMEAARAEFSAWPRSDKLIHMSILDLETHVETSRDRLMCLMDIVQEMTNLPANITGQPEARFGCHIQDQIEDKILSCNAGGMDKRTSDKSEESDFIEDRPDGQSDYLEKQNGEVSVPDKPKLVLPRISNGALYALSSEEMQMHFDIAGGGERDTNPTLYAIETGVWTRLSEIGTNLSAWHDALEQMGLLGAIVAGVLTDAKVSDPKQPVANPGGYFRGMTRAAKRDDLNLIAGWMGLVARRGREEENEW